VLSNPFVPQVEDNFFKISYRAKYERQKKRHKDRPAVSVARIRDGGSFTRAMRSPNES
jgi:hypothetical protein